ncbi:hypothetical protein CY34DRAFT_19560 [Suillus luteus UH-Slu-Lm8-n1]|uniref:Uncharacterized protein n=1 Tax=Suillus luteus UH-Slu-Lm8-n1 TaxID=930992 RepID=A0A0D0AIF1_9AGAM|nr:hypothetical protein CY34DRAFT_19560 [Suillus luteus UH-Slu-Lm8-n1]
MLNGVSGCWDRPDQFTGVQDSAWAIIESIAQQPRKEPLSIQRDIGVSRIRSSTTQSSVRKEEGRASSTLRIAVQSLKMNMFGHSVNDFNDGPSGARRTV